MISSIRQSMNRIGPGGRRFVFFNFVNGISWQCMAGHQLPVLFARSIDMPQRYVGLLISFMPLAMILAIPSLPLLERFGPRKMMISVWIVRAVIMLNVFWVPLAMAKAGPEAAWLVLLLCTMLFCAARGLGVGGFWPWVHEVVPSESRGEYFSLQQVSWQVVNVGIAFFFAIYLGGDPGIFRFLSIYVIGISTGFVAVFSLARIPGGRIPGNVRSSSESFASLGRAMRDKRFRSFVIIGAVGATSSMWLIATMVMFLRDQLNFSEGPIMAILGLGNVATILTVRRWGRFADIVGSGRSMSLALWGISIGSLVWMTLAPGTGWGQWGPWVAMPVTMTFVAAYQALVARAMMQQIVGEDRIGYTNLWTVAFGITWGVTPILAGLIIDRWDLQGFEICFGAAAVTSLAVGLVALRVRDNWARPAPYRTLLRMSAQPFYTLGQLAILTLGVGEPDRIANRVDTTSFGSPIPEEEHPRGEHD